MSNIITLLKTISKFFMIITKIIFITLTLYYILNFNIYKITLNVPTSWRLFSIIDLPLKAIEFIGMGFLAIPLAFVIQAFFHPEIRFLQIIANFFAISGNIFSVGFLASKGLLEDFFRTRFFTVYNAPSLETKTNIFSNFFHDKIRLNASLIPDKEKYESFIQKWMNANGYEYFNKTLSSTPISEIEQKAYILADMLHKLFLDSLVVVSQTSSTTSGTSSWKVMGLLVISTIITTVGLWYLYNKIYKTAQFTRENTEEINKVTNIVTATNENTKQVTETVTQTSQNVQQMSVTVDTISGDILSATRDQMELKTYVTTSMDQIKHGLEYLTKACSTNNMNMADLSTRVQSLSSQVDILVEVQTTLSDGHQLFIRELSTLKAALDNIHSNMPQVTSIIRDNCAFEAEVRQFRGYLDKLKEIDVTQMRKAIMSGLESVITPKMESKFAELAQEQENKVSSLVQKFLSNKLSGLTTKVEATAAKVEVTNARVEEVAGVGVETLTFVTVQTSKVNTQEALLHTHTKEISVLKTTHQTQSDALTLLNRKIEEQQQLINALQESRQRTLVTSSSQTDHVVATSPINVYPAFTANVGLGSGVTTPFAWVSSMKRLSSGIARDNQKITYGLPPT